MNNFIGKNSIKNLSKILEKENFKNVLIFRGRKSFETIKATVEKELQNCNITYYYDFSINPKKEEIDIAIKNLKKDFDAIIAIGGGSVIDFAKAFRYYTKPAKLIAIPTTCGTGSEATQFAVIYINGIKTSLDKPEILPDFTIVDSQFVENNPKYLKACTAMDAYCQAIESFWAVKSTEKSREYAARAIELCRDNIVEYVNSNDANVAEKMALASNLAGKAINISRTTAAHALSYKITSDYKIPHGHAVALSISKLFELNLKIDKQTNNDSRGLEFVKDILFQLQNLLPSDYKSYFKNLFEAINLEMDLNILKIDNIKNIVNEVNIERLGNNPKKLNQEDLLNIFIQNN